MEIGTWKCLRLARNIKRKQEAISIIHSKLASENMYVPTPILG
jgi:hypothetical protein